MTTLNRKPRAIALLSGGLDSMLAAKVVADQGVHVEGVNFFTGFCVEGHTQAIRSSKQTKIKRHDALASAEKIGIKLQFVDIAEEYKEIVLNPRHGYGRLMNPCLDCKIFMIKQALQLECDDGYPFDFVITGEVVGQRPKSQRSDTMPIIAKESGATDRLLRPLCALKLPETLPERSGWVERSKLYSFVGRSRKPQIALAAKMGITDFAQPSGGCCFLTDEAYTNKLKDLFEARHKRDYDLEDVVLLKIGRHIRPKTHIKLIVGRDEGENRFLRGLRYKFTILEPVSHLGALALVDGEPTSDELAMLSRVVGRYCKGCSESNVTIRATQPDGTSMEFEIEPMLPNEIPKRWHVGF